MRCRPAALDAQARYVTAAVGALGCDTFFCAGEPHCYYGLLSCPQLDDVPFDMLRRHKPILATLFGHPELSHSRALAAYLGEPVATASGSATYERDGARLAVRFDGDVVQAMKLLLDARSISGSAGP
ncbi:MAG: hypothetical protein U1F43_29210 [Myxococcota bacterium]